MDIKFTWTTGGIRQDKAQGRNDGLYSSDVLWGISINGICNPTMKTFIEEVNNELEQIKERIKNE